MRNNMKSARERAGLTRQQLADIVGVSRVSIHRYEDGTRTPSVGMAIKIKAALGNSMTIEELLKEDE